jgi:hypothetical protein
MRPKLRGHRDRPARLHPCAREHSTGDELFIDYGLSVDGEITDEIRAHYARRCGAPGCRQSMLAAAADSEGDFSGA